MRRFQHDPACLFLLVVNEVTRGLGEAENKKARPGDDSHTACASVCVCVSVIVPLRLTSSCGEQPAKTSLRKPQRSLAFAAFMAGEKKKKTWGMSDIWKHCETT